MNYFELIYGCVAVICAALIAFTATPIIRVLAYKIGAIDVPKDERRMHKEPIPRIGGLAIFAAFTITTLVFCKIDNTLLTIWVGGLIIACIGVIDDVYRLKAWIKLIVQIAVAVIAVCQGITIDFINIFGHYVPFGIWSIPITILWIVGLTNAINLIDGLDGLACGVCTISSVSLFFVAVLTSQWSWAMPLAILVGSCMGFLPFNQNPAKIFMGDTGALFLGYTLSILSIQGIFKAHMVLSFIIPISIFGLPLFDTLLAIIRRIAKKENPFTPDRKHIHHMLMDMGFGQKYSVRILYAVCGILGVAAVMFTSPELYKPAVIMIVGFIIFILNYIIFKKVATRDLSGIPDNDASAAANKGGEENNAESTNADGADKTEK